MPGNIQVLRFEPRKQLDIKLHLHQLGELRPTSARALDTPAHVYFNNFQAARDALTAAIAARKGVRGPKPHHALDLVLAGPPGFKTEHEWPEEKVHAWGRDCVAWAVDLMGPNTVFSSAALHYDEGSPHLHLLCVPIDSEGKLGWKSVLREATERLNGGVPLPRKKGGDYGFVQDHLYETVSRHYGMERGQKGNRVTHQAIDRLKGAERSIQIIEAEAEELRAARAQAEAHAADLHAQLVAESKAMVGDARAQARDVIASAGSTADEIVSKAKEGARRQAEEDARLGTAGGIGISRAAREGRRLRADWEQKVDFLEAELAATQGERDAAQAALKTAEEEVVTVRDLMRTERADMDTLVATLRKRAEDAEAYLSRFREREHEVRPAALTQARREHEATVRRMTEEHQAVVEERDRLREEGTVLRERVATVQGLLKKAADVGKSTFFNNELVPILREAGLLETLSRNRAFARLLNAAARQRERHRAEARGRETGDD